MYCPKQEVSTSEIVSQVQTLVEQSDWFADDKSGAILWTVCETLLACATSEDCGIEPLRRHAFLIMVSSLARIDQLNHYGSG